MQLEIRLGGFVLRGEIPCGETVPLTTVARKTGSDPRTLDRYWGFADGPSAEDFTYPLPADPNQVETLGAGTAYRTTWMRRADGEIARTRRRGIVFSCDRNQAAFDRMMADHSD